MDDFLLIDQNLSSEEKLIRDHVRRAVAEQFLPEIPQAYEQADFPRAWVKRLAELGILGMTLPAEFGGRGATAVSYGLACQELEYGDSGLRSFMSVQSSLCMYPIFRFGSDAQKKKYLPVMAAGELIASFALTEHEHGSDPAHLTTTAKPVKNGWLLNGKKMWITNAPLADFAIIWAQTPDGIRGFLVDASSAGYQVNEIQHKLSMRACRTGEIVLQDCVVPAESILPGTEIGLGAALNCLNQARYGIAWGAMGAAMACYDAAVFYAKQRQQFGKAIGSFQLVQKDLVDMLTEIVKAQTLNVQLGRLKEQDKATATMISMAKMNACREAIAIASKARNLLGASGITLASPVMRHMNNLESVFTYEGTDNIHHLILGEHITGLKAFY